MFFWLYSDIKTFVILRVLILTLTLAPTLVLSQAPLSKRYVDDRINQLTYLHLSKDFSFELRYAFDTMWDKAVGHYRTKGDTLLLTFSRDAITSEAQDFNHNTSRRADSLIIKGHFLYKIINGRSGEYEHDEIVTHKPLDVRHYRRAYLFFGPWHSTWSKYYMVEEGHERWKKWRRRNRKLGLPT
jgi:hypothetical protein